MILFDISGVIAHSAQREARRFNSTRQRVPLYLVPPLNMRDQGKRVGKAGKRDGKKGRDIGLKGTSL